MGNMSKGKDKGIGKICSSKPTWFDSRTAKRTLRKPNGDPACGGFALFRILLRDGYAIPQNFDSV